MEAIREIKNGKVTWPSALYAEIIPEREYIGYGAFLEHCHRTLDGINRPLEWAISV